MRKYGLLAALLVALLVPATMVSADEGKATWYGPGFQGKVMANGQVYDQYDPTTTACNLYPFGTWLRVSNLANGRTVYVQVRDRGPFTHALDLSYAAFKLLDNPGKMWLQVRYEVVSAPDAAAAPTPTPKPSPTPTPSPTAERPQPSARSSRADQPAQAGQHVVQPGETLWSISRRYGLTVAALQQANNLDESEVIHLGQVLAIKGGAAVPASTPTATPAPKREHVVATGETLSGIAERYSVTVAALQQANKLGDSDVIRVGQRLVVEGGVAAPAAAATAQREHVVAAGDTLSGVAVRYGVSVDQLAQANGLDDPDGVQIGQRLVIPGGSATGSTPGGGAAASTTKARRKYVVQAGDTLSGIADRFGTDSRQLAKLNGIDDVNSLQPGQALLLP